MNKRQYTEEELKQANSELNELVPAIMEAMYILAEQKRAFALLERTGDLDS